MNNLPKRLPALDGLRGLAAVIVLVSHSANAGLLPEELGGGFGRAGVAIFYALSGFLMAHVNFGQSPGAANLASYARARISRVLPLYFVALGLGSLAYVALNNGFYGLDAPREIVLSALLLKGESVLWSVPVEMHFYVVFVGIWIAQSRGYLFTALLALGLPVLAFAYWFGGPGERSFYLPMWLHFFLIGIAMRAFFDRGWLRTYSLRGNGWLAWLVPAIALILLISIPPEFQLRLGMGQEREYLDPILIAAIPLLIWCCSLQAGIFRLLATPPMAWIGRVSFSLYLCHLPVIKVLEGLVFDETWPSLLRFAIVAVCAGVLSEISYRLIERPGQRLIRRSTPRGKLDRPNGAREDFVW